MGLRKAPRRRAGRPPGARAGAGARAREPSPVRAARDLLHRRAPLARAGGALGRRGSPGQRPRSGRGGGAVAAGGLGAARAPERSGGGHGALRQAVASSPGRSRSAARAGQLPAGHGPVGRRRRGGDPRPGHARPAGAGAGGPAAPAGRASRAATAATIRRWPIWRRPSPWPRRGGRRADRRPGARHRPLRKEGQVQAERAATFRLSQIFTARGDHPGAQQLLWSWVERHPDDHEALRVRRSASRPARTGTRPPGLRAPAGRRERRGPHRRRPGPGRRLREAGPSPPTPSRRWSRC
jgi:hypothetical protein